MKIAVIGGGPGGLYFSILTKKALPDCIIDVYERNKPDDSFGFGVVFSDETLGEFLKRDMQSYELIRSNFAYWDDIVIARDGQTVNIAGNGFCGCSRKTLLKLLHQRCREEGVNLHFEQNIDNIILYKDADIIIASDGIASGIRSKYENEFGTKIVLKKNRFVWLGSTKPLDAFTYYFRTTPFGVIVAHTYQYEPGMSTWIFECTNETWEKFNFEITNEEDTISKIAEIFKNELEGHPLISNKSHWRQFPHITNQNWFYENIVLLGDSKATAHYSIGSGTKLAMECAIALSDAIILHQKNYKEAFALYEQKRRKKVEIIQHAANVSLDWFENMNRYSAQPFYQFAFGCMTRSKKVTFDNLKLRDASFTKKVLEEYNTIQKVNSNAPAFIPFTLRSLKLENRIVMAPMGQYSANEGVVNDWHFQHYISRAIGGVGLIITEMTAIASNGRITKGCAGIYTEEQTNAWKKIVSFIHQHSRTKIAIQMGHAGRKGSLTKPWEGSLPLLDSWPLIAASAIPFSENHATPREITFDEMNEVIKQFVIATINAEKAGFDMIELQAHHGFLLASFLSPLTNKRSDDYGGSIENRMKFPLEVFKAIRDVFPSHKPISVRISATDWHLEGNTEQEILYIAKMFTAAGADCINVSTGNTINEQNPSLGRMYQVPFSDFIKNEAKVNTITAGNITEVDQINTILLNGKADLVALGKPLLTNPYFAIHAQAREQHLDDNFPIQYKTALKPFYEDIALEKQQIEMMKKTLKPKSNKI